MVHTTVCLYMFIVCNIEFKLMLAAKFEFHPFALKPLNTLKVLLMTFWVWLDFGSQMSRSRGHIAIFYDRSCVDDSSTRNEWILTKLTPQVPHMKLWVLLNVEGQRSWSQGHNVTMLVYMIWCTGGAHSVSQHICPYRSKVGWTPGICHRCHSDTSRPVKRYTRVRITL